MKATTTYHGEKITVYAIDLCHYGDRGDYEVFPDRVLTLDVCTRSAQLAGAGFEIDYTSAEVSVFRDRYGTEFTMYPDGRLIVEGLRPGSPRQAFDAAAEILGYGI